MHLKVAYKWHIMLQVWHQKSMLLSLDDDGVSAYKLPGLQLHCLVNRTRHAQRFAWDPAKGALAVAIKRRLLLFIYDGNEFVEQKELSLSDTALRLAWLGEALCVAFKKECVLLVDFPFLPMAFTSPFLETWRILHVTTMSTERSSLRMPWHKNMSLNLTFSSSVR